MDRQIAPAPPYMLVPPMITDAMACSSIPAPAVGWPRDSRETAIEAARPAASPAQAERGDLDALGPDARQYRCFLIASDREDPSSERRRVQCDGQGDHENDHDDDRDINRPHLSAAKPGEGLVADRQKFASGDQDRNPLENEAARERGEKGVDVQVGDGKAVNQS